MKRAINWSLPLLVIWLASYFYMLGCFEEQNFFVPSFASILTGLGFVISPHKDVKSFCTSLRFGRAFYSIAVLALIAFFGGNGTRLNWAIIPPVIGLFFLTSAIVDRMDSGRN